MKNITVYALAALIASLIFWTLPYAEPISATQKNPCSEDIAKFCKNVAPTQMAIMACLEENEKNLSAACKNYEMNVMHGKRAEMGEDSRAKKQFLKLCRQDINKYCKDADLQPGGYVKCIKEHQSELSPPCAGWVKESSKMQ